MSEKIRMAIIDDERHITDHVRRIIEERFVGLFEIMVSSDAETVVEALKRYEIPIIISDIRMPKMNGIDFMKYVHENYPSTKFLLLSAYPNFLSACPNLPAPLRPTPARGTANGYRAFRPRRQAAASKDAAPSLPHDENAASP